MRVRVRLAPHPSQAHAYTLSVATDGRPANTELITGLDAVSQDWRLAIGAAHWTTQAGMVLVRDVSLAVPHQEGAAHVSRFAADTVEGGWSSRAPVAANSVDGDMYYTD